MEGLEVNEADGLTNMLMSSYGADTACDVLLELRRGWEVQKTLAAVEQQRIAQSIPRIGRHSVEGLGQQTHSVSLTAYLYWHARTNGQCWKDPAFWAEFGRDNPATKVAYAPRCATIIHPGLPRPEPLIQLTGEDAYAAA